jgi:hypothetical protein
MRSRGKGIGADLLVDAVGFDAESGRLERWESGGRRAVSMKGVQDLPAAAGREKKIKMMVLTYRDDRADLRVPRPHATDGVPSREWRCRWQMTLGWLSGRGAVRCGNFGGEDLPEVQSSPSQRGETKEWVRWTYWKPLRPRRGAGCCPDGG